jgi:hypothetical protein
MKSYQWLKIARWLFAHLIWRKRHKNIIVFSQINDWLLSDQSTLLDYTWNYAYVVTQCLLHGENRSSLSFSYQKLFTIKDCPVIFESPCRKNKFLIWYFIQKKIFDQIEINVFVFFVCFLQKKKLVWFLEYHDIWIIS